MKNKCYKCRNDISHTGFKICRVCLEHQDFCIMLNCFKGRTYSNIFCEHHSAKYYKENRGLNCENWSKLYYKKS